MLVRKIKGIAAERDPRYRRIRAQSEGQLPDRVYGTQAAVMMDARDAPNEN
jgi:hypothetical protein